MKSPQPLLLSLFLAVCLAPANVRADGSFVAPKFVWDEHKDINEPTQKAIIVYDAGEEDLVLQVKYEGPLDQFGWLVPVPDRPTVRHGSMECFYELSRFTQRQRQLRLWQRSRAASYGSDAQSASGPPPVNVIETEIVGGYDVAVLSAKDSGALAQWLDDNHFYIPPNKSHVLDAYIQMHWYFVAVRIDLGRSFLQSTSNRLESGELSPLQISFASQRCIFPLKISSINGTPSEVQVYVLAQEPLLEQGMYEHDLPLIYSNDVARLNKYEQTVNQIDQRMKTLTRARLVPPLDDDTPPLTYTPVVTPDEVMEYNKAASGDLTACARMIPRLKGRSWWVLKKTWSFDPGQMRDLDFGPALPALAEMLGSAKYGYIAGADLSMLGTDAIPVVLAAVQSRGPAMRANAADILYDGGVPDPAFVSDPRVKAAVPALLKNPEPNARLAAIDFLTSGTNQAPDTLVELLPLLADSDAKVREYTITAISRSPDVEKFAPLFHKMLTDTNPAARLAGLRVINMKGLPISNDELFRFFKMPDRAAISISTGYFRNMYGRYALSNKQAIPLLHNTEPLGRIIGLRILGQNAADDSIELATPLLDDPNPTVQHSAALVISRLKAARSPAE